MWPVALSGRLPVEALVSHYLTNKLIGRESIPNQKISFQPTRCLASSYPVLATVSDCYPRAEGRLLTCYSPVRHSCTPKKGLTVRLACVKHTASVRPEPGSNSPSKKQNRHTHTNRHRHTQKQFDRKPNHQQTPTTHTNMHATGATNQRKKQETNQKMIHPQKNGIDLKHAVEFSRFGSHQSSNPVNLTAFPPNVKFSVPALSCTFSEFATLSGSFSTVLPGPRFRKSGLPTYSQETPPST